MGNTSSDVNNNLKAQADSANGPEVYKLTSVAGGGLLVDMMKRCMASKNYTEIDDYIKNTQPQVGKGRGQIKSNQRGKH